MVLRGIHYANIFNASGARGWLGEGYPFHKYWKHFGLRYEGCTFVSKTTTLHPRKGNMPFHPKTFQPTEFLPKCVVVKPWAGVVLNSIGLSGPGADRLIDRWCVEMKEDPFFISFMSVEPTAEARLHEARQFVGLLLRRYAKLPRHMGIQVNFSCPNVGLDTSTLVEEVTSTLNEFAHLELPCLAKLNVLFPVEAAVQLQTHAALDGIVMGNTVPWGKLPEKIDWRGLFGSEVSPLARFGGGGLSGKPLLPLVADWVLQARKAGFSKVIIAGGGILDTDDADRLLDVGADGLELGSVSILRPWRVAKIIRYVNFRTAEA
jgi:dihydroorotate dehydrogenase